MGRIRKQDFGSVDFARSGLFGSLVGLRAVKGIALPGLKCTLRVLLVEVPGRYSRVEVAGRLGYLKPLGVTILLPYNEEPTAASNLLSHNLSIRSTFLFSKSGLCKTGFIDNEALLGIHLPQTRETSSSYLCYLISICFSLSRSSNSAGVILPLERRVRL